MREFLSSPSPPSSEKKEDAAISRARVVDCARSWLGTLYLHQASAKGAGCDCLGLIRGVWRELYGAEPEAPPPYTPDWNEARRAEEPLLSAARRHLVDVKAPSVRLADSSSPPPLAGEAARRAGGGPLRSGQVLIFRIVTDGPAKHCGVVSGKDRFIHAYAGRCVIESWLNRWWRARIAGIFDFPGVME